MNSYFKSIKEMQNRMFHVLIIAASLVNLFGVVLNAFLHGNAFPTWVCIGGGGVILILGLLGYILNQKSWATVLILITVVWIEFPFLYIVYGDVILVYFVLSILGITIFFPMNFSLPFCIMTIVWDILVVVGTHDVHYAKEYVEERYLILFDVCSFLIVSIATYALLNILIFQYERQKEKLFIANARLDYMATHDPLTKLYNRGYLMKELEKRVSENDKKFIVVIMDVDNFKSINDTYGHSFGDCVLVTFAKYMDEMVENRGFASRFGGEEFVVVWENDNIENVLEELHKLAIKLEEYFQKENQVSVTFSGGLEIYDKSKRTDELIVNADKKLYEAKRNGKNRIVS